MYIDQFMETVKFCRFCFMCRHLAPVGNVTFTEADTPRIRASMIYGATLRKEEFTNKDLIRIMYRSDLSGCCRRNCVNHYDEVGLTLAYRADLVEMGCAPEYIEVLKKDLVEKSSDWKLSGEGKVLYVEDSVSAEAGSAGAFKRLAGECMTLSGSSCGKGLWVLGYRKEAEIAAQKFAAVVEKSGAETVVVTNPALYDMLVNTFREMGVTLTAKVMFSSEYLASLRTAEALGDLYYLESDYLLNYNGNKVSPKELLAANGGNLKFFGTNDEESYSCGEGALLLDRIEPALVEKLAKYVEERADDAEHDRIITASPYTKIQLSRYTALQVLTVEELLAQSM